MQLYAFDSAGRKVFIASACSGQDYFCMECKGRMRLRRTVRRKSHFFHLATSEQSCRLAGKTLFHIATQQCIQEAIGSANCDQEVYFESIGRIADIAWHEQKIVIEVQCSPISAQEVEERCKDYESVGWQVIWILHDRTFGKHLPSEAERFLKHRTHYYTDINQHGGHIYDRYGKKALPITISTLNERSAWGELRSDAFPLFVQERIAKWQYSALGDVLWHAMQEGAGGFAREIPMKRFRDGNLFRGVRSLIQSFWHLLLERSCK